MIEDLLQEIVALEKEQDAKVRMSVQESKDNILKATEKAIQIDNYADNKIKQMSAENIEKANKDAKKNSDKIIADAEKKAAEIIAVAEKNSDKITADIIRRLEVRYA